MSARLIPDLVEMAVSNCGVCKGDVSIRSGGVACERCEGWYHMPCVGLSTNIKCLKNKNLVYLCSPCLERSRLEWKGEAERNEDRGVQTESEAVEKSTQVEKRAEVMPQVGTQTEEPQKKKQDGPAKPNVKKMMKKKAAIRIIGDSMVRRVGTHVKLNSEGSACTSLRGARVEEIKKKVVEEAETLKDGLLIVQGGGNSLEEVGEEVTVREAVAAVRAVEGKNMSVAVVGVMRRPREGPQYEQVRKRTNRRIQEELMKMKCTWLKEKKGNVSFIDTDRELKDDRLFAVDGVHLNDAGNEKLGRRLCEWVRARSWCPMTSE